MYIHINTYWHKCDLKYAFEALAACDFCCNFCYYYFYMIKLMLANSCIDAYIITTRNCC